MTQPNLADRIAQASIDLYNTLPKHGKPHTRDNGISEWTILATISLVTDSGETIIPISLGTGVKVLPANKLPPLGDVLHDCHAEVLARRGFMRWMIEEGKKCLDEGKETSEYMSWNGELTKFVWKEVEIWLYVSTLPCGDASTYHTAVHQPPEMAALKTSSNGSSTAPINGNQVIRGRNGYKNYGAIRTKPGRADSVPAISHSCSDKIASWNILGLQGALLSDLWDPVYLSGIAIGGVEADCPINVMLPDGQTWWDRIRSEVERAMYERLETLSGSLAPPYELHRPTIEFTALPFPDSKNEVQVRTGSEPVPSVHCLSHIPSIWKSGEVVYNGCRQGGIWKSPGTKLLPEKSRSRICKYEIFRAFTALMRRISTIEILPGTGLSYYAIKHSPVSSYQAAKTLLRGRPGSPGVIPAFGKAGTFAVTESHGGLSPPFVGWIVSGQRWEMFDVDGRSIPVEETCSLERP